MAIQIIDGFDLYNGVVANTGLQAKWTPVSLGALAMVAGRFGGQALRSPTGGGNNVVRSFPAATSGSLGFAHKTTLSNAGAGFADDFVTLYAAGVAQISLAVNLTGQVQAIRSITNSGQVLLGQSAGGVIVTDTWQYIEMEWTISATVGVFNIWVDGVRVLNLTGINTAVSGATTVDSVGLYSFRGISTYCDDFYLTTGAATRLGEARVETLRPSADTATKNWTPNSGTANFSRVNETLCDGDTSYISATTVGTADLYDIADLSSTPAAIFAVQLTAFSEKTDATTRAIVLTAKSGATSLDSSQFPEAANYTKKDAIFATDPNTSAAWTVAAVNALQIGPKVAV